MTVDRLDDIGALVAFGDLDSAADLLADGFPSADLVPVALGQVPGQVRPDRSLARSSLALNALRAERLRGLSAGWAQGEGPQGAVIVSAGTVQMVARDEARLERSRNRDADRQPMPLALGVEVLDAQGVALVDDDGRPLRVDPRTGEVLGEWQEVALRRRGRITAWSRKSRANLIRRMASTDWRPLFAYGIAPMTTLTYPGPWFAFAPTRADVGRHLEAFKERYRRAYLADLGLPVLGAWKVEYQRRGAPHLHLLLPIPSGVSLVAFRAWVAETWHSVIWQDRGGDLLRLLALLGHDATAAALIYAEHSDRSLAAGTAVDEAEGARLRDPRRLALYFLGHSLAHARDGGKEYQHVLPTSYAGRAGRWWGIWGCQDTSQGVFLDAESWWALRDALAAHAAAAGRQAFQGGRMFGGWLAVDDGPALLLEVLAGLDV